MFSQEKRCLYRNNALANVICQLRFPEILSISANLPVPFQEAIRAEYSGDSPVTSEKAANTAWAQL